MSQNNIDQKEKETTQAEEITQSEETTQAEESNINTPTPKKNIKDKYIRVRSIQEVNKLHQKHGWKFICMDQKFYIVEKK